MVKLMRSSLFIAILFFFFGISSYAQTWNGSVSSAWNTAANWTPATIPGAGNDVTINNAAAPNQPILPSDLTIRDLNISDGILDLASFTLTITRNANISGGTILQGTILVNNFTALQNTIFQGDITLTKTAGGNNDLQGGNTFDGPTVINNDDNSRLRLANSDGDTFNSTVTFNKNNSGQFQIAYDGANTFGGTVTVNNSNATSNLSFGAGGGTSLLTAGGLTTTDFNIGTLIINNFSQVTAAANGSFSPAVFTVSNVVFLGNFQVTTTGAINFNNTNFFNGTNVFTAGTQITMPDGNNRFSVISGSTQITRTGGAGVTWGPNNRFGNLTLRDLSAGQLTMEGGNTFNGTTNIINETNNNIQFANVTGDTFNGPVFLQNNGTAYMDVARRGTNIFEAEITINNTNANGEVRFGEFGGTIELRNGGLVTTDFSVCNVLELNNFTQMTNAPNGSFNANTITFNNVLLRGDIQATTTGSGNLNFQNANTFEGNNVFVANAQIVMDAGGNTFSLPGNTTSITRNGGGNRTWGAGNSFGTLTLTDNANTQLYLNGSNTFHGPTLIQKNGTSTLRMGNTSGDTYLSTSTFINTGTGTLDIGYAGASTFADEITINNLDGAGSLRFGNGGGSSVLSSGALVTTDFAACNVFEVRNFTQSSSTTNGNFNANTITFNNATFRGDIQATTTGSGTFSFLNNSAFEGNNVFTAAAQMSMPNGGNTFSLPGNTTLLTRNGGAGVTWGAGNSFGILTLTDNSDGNLVIQGGNTFNNAASITKNGNAILRLGNTIGDTFLSTSMFVNNGTSTFDIGYGGTNTFEDEITVNNLNGAGTVRFGANGGTNVLNSGGLITTDFSSGAALNISNFTQSTNAANGTFTVNTFTSSNSSFLGDFSVTAASAGITLTSSTFNGTNLFDAATGIGMTGGNNLSVTPGNTTTMIKRGTTDNDWQGGNVFGNFILEHRGTGRIRMANSVGGDLFSGNVTFRRLSTGELALNRTNNSDYRGNIALEGSPTIGANGGIMRISGGSNRSFNADASVTIPRLEMNTTGSPTLTVNVPVAISVQLTLNSGIFANDENLLTINNTASVSGGSNASHVDGRIRKVGNTAFTYPFGNDGFYAPLTTTALGGSTAQHFTGRYFHTNPELAGYSRASKEATLGEINECEYWEFERTNSAVTPTITLTWSDDRTCPIVDFNEFVFTKWNGTQWIDLEAADLTGDATTGSVRNSIAIPSFAPPIFTLAQSFRILPVEILSFGAVAIDNKQVRVSWSTASEENNAYFTVERSLDGKKWSAIGIVPGVGNSDRIESYEFIDERPVFGRQFYRITQTDFDGKSQTFRVVGVTLTGSALEVNRFKVYPNPSSGQVKVFSENSNLEQAEIAIVNQQGQEMMAFENVNGRLFEIDLSHLPKGLYLIRIKNNHQLVSKKVVIQ